MASPAGREDSRLPGNQPQERGRREDHDRAMDVERELEEVGAER